MSRQVTVIFQWGSKDSIFHSFCLFVLRLTGNVLCLLECFDTFFVIKLSRSVAFSLTFHNHSFNVGSDGVMFGSDLMNYADNDSIENSE